MANYSGFVALSVLGGFLIAAALYCLRVSIRELLSGQHFRAGLAGQITRLRLGRLFARHDIDLHDYLSSQTAAEILRQIRNCKQCRNLSRCDYYLNEMRRDNDIDPSFCPNRNAIARLRQRLQS
ncbi:MAG: DUF6455 family protein [Pseudomonadota bacterium]